MHDTRDSLVYAAPLVWDARIEVAHRDEAHVLRRLSAQNRTGPLRATFAAGMRDARLLQSPRGVRVELAADRRPA